MLAIHTHVLFNLLYTAIDGFSILLEILLCLCAQQRLISLPVAEWPITQARSLYTNS